MFENNSASTEKLPDDDACASTHTHTYIHIISFHRSSESVVQTAGHETCQKKTTQTERQNRPNAQYKAQYKK
jgi:hypothetical protein